MDDRRPRAPQPRRNPHQVVNPSVLLFVRLNTPRRAFPRFRGRSPRPFPAGQIGKQSASRSRPSTPKMAQGCLSACESAGPDAARPRLVALSPRPDSRAPADLCVQVSAPIGGKPSTGSTPASRLNHSGDGCGAGWLGFPARKFGAGLAHPGDQLSTPTLGDAAAQRRSQLLLFLQGESISGGECARVGGHGWMLARAAGFFNYSVRL